MLWVKAFHIIAVVCWFAMLFYLPRLFVYHSMSEDKISRDRFIIMERKLYWGIGTPSMITTLVLGFWAAVFNWDYYASATWFWLKISLVSLLVAYHISCAFYLKQFARGLNPRSHIFFRIYNELPVFALIAVVILVVVRQPS